MYRIDILLKENHQLFHTRDLALLWDIENDNTLYTTIKRYVDRGILIPIHKGFYSTLSLDKVDPILLGITSLRSYAYLSCEYILSIHGIIFQPINYITLISSVSKRFTITKHQFLVRKLADRYLFSDLGIKKENGIYQATVERAVADIQYFNPYYHFDNRKGVNFEKVKRIKMEIGYL